MDSDYSIPEDVSQIDPENLKQDILQLPFQAAQGYKLAEGADLSSLDKEVFYRVLITGMGGSSIAGLVLKDYLQDLGIVLAVNQDYTLPKWVDKKTLVIASSYSGNTEETLSSFKEARRRDCKIIAVTVGGKLAELAKQTRIPVIGLPQGFQPRAALGIQFFTILRLLQKLKLIEPKGIDVDRFREDIKVQLPGIERNAMALSEKLAGKIPIIYTSSQFSSIGYRWKCQFNENAKTPAFQHYFSELNHNEMNGFENVFGSFHLIMLRFEDDSRRLQSRMDLTKEIILSKGVPTTEIGIRGTNILTKMFASILLGDLTSYFLALRYRTNPSKVSVVEEFKKRLGPFI
ncbi:bifunctional phosphoglucose/phosphomannose isomerase [Candidatus Woesearchaeota archaeon]|nr:bifunctional phosphoglucose/phosphomannose isomerase [Candidatus Woesearchaeota archaeon]